MIGKETEEKKKEASRWRGESYSEGRLEFAYSLSPLATGLLLKKKKERETLTVTHILKKLNFIIKSKKKIPFI